MFAAGSRLSLALDQNGNVCATKSGGGYGLNILHFADMLETAKILGARLMTDANKAIEERLDDRQREVYGADTAHGLLTF